MVKSLTLFLFFRVLLSLVPIVYNGVRIATTGGQDPFGAAIERGELLLLTAALCGGSVGVLIGSDATFQIYKIISGGAAIIILMLSSLYYADISSLYRQGVPVNVNIVKTTSRALFLLGVIASGSSVALSGV
jgi:hypothetical protein